MGQIKNIKLHIVTDIKVKRVYSRGPMLKDILNTISRYRQSSGLRVRPMLIQGPETEALAASQGGIKPRPEQRVRGVLYLWVTVIPFVTLGAYLAKKGAGILEEFEIFVPEDEDDD